MYYRLFTLKKICIYYLLFTLIALKQLCLISCKTVFQNESFKIAALWWKPAIVSFLLIRSLIYKSLYQCGDSIRYLRFTDTEGVIYLQSCCSSIWRPWGHLFTTVVFFWGFFSFFWASPCGQIRYCNQTKMTTNCKHSWFICVIQLQYHVATSNYYICYKSLKETTYCIISTSRSWDESG